MRGVVPILRKDFASFCRSWAGVFITFSFLLVGGIFFTLFVLGYTQLSLQAANQAHSEINNLSLTAFIMGAFFLNQGVVLLFLAPLLSMRSLAEEKRIGTLELLYTFPLSDFEITFGKYLALLAMLLLLLIPTLAYVGVMRILGMNVEGGVVLSGATGFFLLGASFLAIGLFFSSLTENQILAAALTFSLLLGLWILEWLFGFIPGTLGARLAKLSLFAHFRDFPLGIIDFSDIAFLLCVIFFFFFLTLRTVETRNWRG